MSKVILQPKASVPFKHSLVCQLPAVSRDRGLSEAIATDFLFEAIQLVTCEVTFSFPVFPPHQPSSHISSDFPSFFLKAKFGLKKFKKQKWKFKQQPPPLPLAHPFLKRQEPSGCSALGDPTLEVLFF